MVWLNEENPGMEIGFVECVNRMLAVPGKFEIDCSEPLQENQKLSVVLWPVSADLPGNCSDVESGESVLEPIWLINEDLSLYQCGRLHSAISIIKELFKLEDIDESYKNAIAYPMQFMVHYVDKASTTLRFPLLLEGGPPLLYRMLDCFLRRTAQTHSFQVSEEVLLGSELNEEVADIDYRDLGRRPLQHYPQVSVMDTCPFYRILTAPTYPCLLNPSGCRGETMLKY